MIKKQISFVVVLATLFVAIAGLFVSVSCKRNKQPKGLEKVSLRLAWVYDMSEVGIFVAKDQGYYEKEGIDLDIQQGGFGIDPLRLVAAGSNDFGVGGAVNLLLAREKEIPLVAIAAEYQNTPVGFIVRKDSGITSFTDFRGRKVGVQTGADTDTLYRALLAKFGMTSKDVREVPIQYDPMPFVSRQIDVLPGYITNQPITLANQGIETSVISAASQGMNIYGNVYFVSEKTLNERRDLVQRFLRATRAGWEDVMRNPEHAISAMKARSQDFTDEDLATIYKAVMPLIKPEHDSVQLLGMTKERWESTYELLKAAGLSTASISIEDAFLHEASDIANHVTNSKSDTVR